MGRKKKMASLDHHTINFCTGNGSRTHTAITGQRIFLLLLLLYKPPTSFLFRCCSLDYFLTLSYDLGSACIVSTPFRKYLKYFHLVSHHQSLYFYKRGFCLLGQFYSKDFSLGTLIITN